MSKSLLRTDKEIAEIYMRHCKTVYLVFFVYTKNPADTEDAVQDTFFHLIKSGPAFKNEEHEKACLIRTAANICKDVLRHWWRRRENLEKFHDLQSSEEIETDDVFRVVMALPIKYKAVIYLHYYEGYTSVEISGILKKPQSTIRNYLHEARAILRERLGDDFNEDDKIIVSWNKIEPCDSADERMLSAILERNRSVRNRKDKENYISRTKKRLILAVACMALLIAVIGILGGNLVWFGSKDYIVKI